jgi:2-methylcitrate dehydratase PrpD
VIPAALSVGEAIGASGREVLTAMVAGYETMIRISLATGPNASRRRGWHLTGTTGTFGAAAAAGRLLGLGRTTWRARWVMAGTQSARALAFRQTGHEQAFPSGRWPERVLAAYLAQKGFRWPTQILEAEDGGSQAMSIGSISP